VRLLRFIGVKMAPGIPVNGWPSITLSMTIFSGHGVIRKKVSETKTSAHLIATSPDNAERTATLDQQIPRLGQVKRSVLVGVKQICARIARRAAVQACSPRESARHRAQIHSQPTRRPAASW